MVRPSDKKNWRSWTYVDDRGTRHSDPYKVLVLEPIEPKKTSPTYGDVFMFLEEMLEVEKWNDEHLSRPPQLPSKIARLKKLLSRFVRRKHD